MMKKVLFISPGAEFTGAPIFFLRFLRWIDALGEYSIDIITSKRDVSVF